MSNCPLDKKYGDVVCRDGILWELTYSEMGPPDSRQSAGECPHCAGKKSLTMTHGVHFPGRNPTVGEII